MLITSMSGQETRFNSPLGAWFLGFVLLAATVPLGAVSAPPRYFISAAVSLGFVAYTLYRAARSDTHALSSSMPGTRVSLFAVALPVYAYAQLVTHALITRTDGPLLAIGQAATTFTALVLFFVLVRQFLTDTRRVRILVAILTVLGTGEALYGLLNLLAGNQMLLIWKRWNFLASATGTLASRNHFAYLMELLIPATVAFGLIFTRAHVKRTHRLHPSEYQARRVIAWMATTICIVALIFSHSRMGILSFGFAISCMFLVSRRLSLASDPAETSVTRWLIPAGIAGAIALMLVAAIGMDSVIERFFHIENDFVSGRLPLWKAAIMMFREAPVLGKGWGTYQALLPSYREAPNGYFFTHAHNDYLEVLAEGGVVGFCIVIALIRAFLRRLLWSLRQPLSSSQHTVIVCLGTGLVAALLHSFADYGLRTPGVAFVFVTVAALFSRVSEDPGLISPRRRIRSARGNQCP